ncbi:archaeal proteasome endopeptidase complex subunit alpha [Halomicrococcus gelatinilyticus]|uniref:archaeal proteasome endopeptidase complex subunit alpha n=1 Tax=Halomicrococcus gelatinilyticus TaxID=1702103 RepID=UPI002E160FC6
MNGTNQQAYDRGTNIFSPDGRLYQVEYAREAVRRGSPSVGVRARDGVVLAGVRRLRSPLLEAESVEKLHAADDHVGLASAGHVADARRLVDVGRRRAQADRLRYGEPMGVEAFTKALTDHVQEHTQQGGARPFGAALLVGGMDGDRPRLFETDPSGTPSEWRAAAIGDDGGVREFLEEHYRKDLGVEAAVDLALEALAEPREDGLAPESIAVTTVDPEYRELSPDERRSALDRLDLLDGDAAA